MARNNGKMVDSSFGLVKSSYDDVNNALEGLIGNINANGNASYASKTDLTNLQNTINNAGYATEKELNNLADSVPVGTIFAYSSNNIPTGYLLCNGASFDRTQLSGLSSALGTTTTVPDLRGMFLRGLDTTGNVDNYSASGAQRGILSYEEGSALTADLSGNYSVLDQWANYGNNSQANAAHWWDNPASQSMATFYNNVNGSGSAQGNSGFTTGNAVLGIARPKNVAVNYIIKAYKVANYGYSASALTTQGGTLTGNLVGNKGGTLPQVVGMTGNVSVQTFTVTNNTNNTITFPTPFASNTVPMVFLQPMDTGSPITLSPLVGSVTNTQFSIPTASWVNTEGASSRTEWGTNAGQPIQVMAIGVM